MKKPFLLLLAIIPLFASCNNSGSFPNPFPNDSYTKIGFKTDEKTENITRLLTTAENNLVLDTIAKKDENDKKIYTKTTKRYTREYTKAFAGEFKSGYNVRNLMKDETITITRQDEGEETGEGESKKLDYTARARIKSSNIAKTTSQYSYGQIEDNIEEDDYIYYKKTDGAEYTESALKKDTVLLNQRTKKTENTYVSYDDKTIYTPTAEESEDQKKECSEYFCIPQSQYITAPDSKSGADSKGDIILIAATQLQHKDEETGDTGVYSLKDGRKYQAMDNTLTVTKLTPDKEKTWCLVSYVRIYKETVITSEVIQPNVQVTKLKTPITISYTEEISNFSETKTPIAGELPKEEA